ncbi:hypothetical protein PV327_004731, partial [Microctonus hyperodae]
MYHYLWLISMFICVKAASREPIVRTNFGPIRGKWMNSNRGLLIAAYLGVPYAQPPIGKFRFKSPQPWQQHWINVHNAIEDGPKCPQLDENMKMVGDEDCLNLNIFVPQISDKRKLPVLVYVHGGSFVTGSNNSTLLAPNYLLDQEIILVTVNYRLGIFGFLSSGNEASPGNYGLKDVIEALVWIQANIEDFGGNTSLVTLAGHSAGAAIVHHLALTNRTENLFDKIITHSGSANAPWAIHTAKYSKIRYITIAIELGCTTNRKIMEVDDPSSDLSKNDQESIVQDDMEILKCLRKKNPEDIVKMLSYFYLWRDSPYINFGPVVEPPAEDAVIIKHPMVTIENEEFRDIPWISGVTADEGYIKSLNLILDAELRDEFKDAFDEIITIVLEQEEIIGHHKEYAHQLIQFYFPDFDDLAYDQQSFVNNITMMFGDALFNYWSFEALSRQSSAMNSSAFFFKFTYDGTFSATFSSGLTRNFGITHGDDINYIFPIYNNMYEDLELNNTLNDITMINIMTEMWGNFMKTGIPSAQLSPHWQPYQEDFRFMKLGMGRSPDISMENDFLPMRMEFWNNLMTSVGAPRDTLFPEVIDDNEDGEEAVNQILMNATNLPNSVKSFLLDIKIIFTL